MCEYCDGIKKSKSYERKPLIDDENDCGCIMPTTPIGVRKGKTTPTIRIESIITTHYIEFPINYCPMCGEKLVKD